MASTKLPSLHVPIYLHAPPHAPKRLGGCYKGTITIFLEGSDPATERQFDIMVFPLFLRSHAEPPPREDLVEWFRKADVEIRPTKAQLVTTGTNRDIDRTSFNVLKHIMAHNHKRRFLTLSEAESQVFGRRQDFFEPVDRIMESRGQALYFGEYLFTLDRIQSKRWILAGEGHTQVRLNTMAQLDHPDLKLIRIVSTKNERILPTLECIVQMYQMRIPLEVLWERARQVAKTEADRIKHGQHHTLPPLCRSLYPEPEFCDHGPCHCCRGCLRVFSCETFVEVNGYPTGLCRRCSESNPEIVGRPKRMRRAPLGLASSPVRVLVKNVKGKDWEEQWGVPDKNSDAWINTIMEGLEKEFVVEGAAEATWRDGYVRRQVTESTLKSKEYALGTLNSGMKTADPLRLSADGIHQIAYFEGEDGSFWVGYHIAGNIALTSIFLNVLKQTYPVIVFRVIAVFRSAVNEDDYKRAMRGVHNLRVLTCAFRARLENLRLNPKVARAEVKKQINEMHLSWTTGVISASTLEDCRKEYGQGLFRIPQFGTFAISPPEEQYRWGQFCQIVDEFNIGGEKYLYLWTNKDKNGKLVLFPFSHFSKERIGRSWNDKVCERWFRNKCRGLGLTTTGMNPTFLMFICLRRRMEYLAAPRKTLQSLPESERSKMTLLALDEGGLEPVPYMESPLSGCIWVPDREELRFGYSVTRPTDQETDFNSQKCNIRFTTRATAHGLLWDAQYHKRLFSQLDETNLRTEGPVGIADPKFWEEEYVTASEESAVRVLGDGDDSEDLS